ncbi:hypothetical protein [Pseudomarimonas arenosa]|uniref:Uncharacterized protein n=1 Tax=Pseudomarimonas arenosa TaxID=2774145 RepID=A0AAW3ZIR7_9GAMM|nr:hypothetical protein [Pseudomarimonas arenosa]MBD8524366.1 hypothetical protein [Pseudomarimonas arenosa]
MTDLEPINDVFQFSRRADLLGRWAAQLIDPAVPSSERWLCYSRVSRELSELVADAIAYTDHVQRAEVSSETDRTMILNALRALLGQLRKLEARVGLLGPVLAAQAHVQRDR